MNQAVFSWSTAEDYVIDVPDRSENITVKIDRDVLKDRIKNADARCARLNIANPHLIPVVRQLGSQLLKLEQRVDSLQLQDAVVEMICLMLELNECPSGFELVRRPLTDILYDRLYAYVRRHARDPDLSPDRVACGFNSQSHFSVRFRERFGHSPRECTGGAD